MSEQRISPLNEALLGGALVMILMTVATWLQYAEGHRILIEEFRLGLLSTAKALATSMNGSDHRQLHEAKPEAMQEEPYRSMHATLRKALLSSPEYSYLYTAIRKADGFVFVVDGGEPGTPTYSPLLEPYGGWKANAAIQEAWSTQTAVASGEPYTDDWGTFMSAYAPVSDRDGRFVAVLGVDVNLKEFFLRVEPLKIVAIRSLVGSVLISLVIGALLYLARRPAPSR